MLSDKIFFFFLVKVPGDRDKGLKMSLNNEKKHIKISQLADDTTIILKDEDAVVKGLIRWIGCQTP